jgi:hypothetical protein
MVLVNLVDKINLRGAFDYWYIPSVHFAQMKELESVLEVMHAEWANL